MAKKKASRKIKISFEGVENFTPPPEADYKIGIESVEKLTSEDSGEDYLKWVFAISEGKQKGKKLFYNTSLQPQALWNLRGLLEAFGVDDIDSLDELDLDELQGLDAEAGCTVEHETYRNKNQARIVDIFSGDDVEAGDDDGEEKAELPSAEDIDGMDDDDLEEVVKTLKLDVDLDDFEKTKAKRKAVKEAIDALDRGTEEDSDEAPDVDALDEDELKELISERDLDVDPDDFPKLKALRKAVAKALESAGEEKEDEDGDDAITEDAINAMGKPELAEFVKEHKLKGVELEGNTSKQRRSVIKAAKKAELISDDE